MLGSYYNPYFPTPGQPRIAPGVGAYYPLAASETKSTGLGSLAFSIPSMAINAGAGYLVGKQLGYPVETAIASGLLGILGMAAVAMYASSQKGGAK